MESRRAGSGYCQSAFFTTFFGWIKTLYLFGKSITIGQENVCGKWQTG